VTGRTVRPAVGGSGSTLPKPLTHKRSHVPRLLRRAAEPMSASMKVVVGMLAGAAGGICGSPADIVNIRMQNDGRMPEHLRRNYKNALGTTARLGRQAGRANGLTPDSLRTATYTEQKG